MSKQNVKCNTSHYSYIPYDSVVQQRDYSNDKCLLMGACTLYIAEYSASTVSDAFIYTSHTL